MQHTRLLLHDTTVGTDAIVQLKGVKADLITTRGHGDALISKWPAPLIRRCGICSWRNEHRTRGETGETAIFCKEFLRATSPFSYSGECPPDFN
jgi:hypothetical protein